MNDEPRSASTARLRFTYLYYLLLVGATAVAGRRYAIAPMADEAWSSAALVLVAFAILGRIWCSAFIAGHKDARLVTDGPYSLCRHPLYALSFVGGLGLGIATRSITLTLVTALVLAIFYMTAAAAEERFLSKVHGIAFVRYARETPRWWPRLSRYRIPETMEIKPPIYWKAFLDAGSFVLLYLVIDTVRRLRESGAVPTLIDLP